MSKAREVRNNTLGYRYGEKRIIKTLQLNCNYIDLFFRLS